MSPTLQEIAKRFEELPDLHRECLKVAARVFSELGKDLNNREAMTFALVESAFVKGLLLGFCTAEDVRPQYDEADEEKKQRILKDWTAILLTSIELGTIDGILIANQIKENGHGPKPTTH